MASQVKDRKYFLAIHISNCWATNLSTYSKSLSVNRMGLLQLCPLMQTAARQVLVLLAVWVTEVLGKHKVWCPCRGVVCIRQASVLCCALRVTGQNHLFWAMNVKNQGYSWRKESVYLGHPLDHNKWCSILM